MEAGKWVSDCLRKKRYPSKHIAHKIAYKAKKRRKVKLRVYYCPHCCGFHLTSKV